MSSISENILNIMNEALTDNDIKKIKSQPNRFARRAAEREARESEVHAAYARMRNIENKGDIQYGQNKNGEAVAKTKNTVKLDRAAKRYTRLAKKYQERKDTEKGKTHESDDAAVEMSRRDHKWKRESAFIDIDLK